MEEDRHSHLDYVTDHIPNDAIGSAEVGAGSIPQLLVATTSESICGCQLVLHEYDSPLCPTFPCLLYVSLNDAMFPRATSSCHILLEAYYNTILPSCTLSTSSFLHPLLQQ